MRSSCSTMCWKHSPRCRRPASRGARPGRASIRGYSDAVPENGYSDAELAAMMVDLESDPVERKRSLSTSASEKISRSICALANDLPGHGRPGVVFVGVEDDGRCSGLTIDDRLLQRLAALRDDGRLLPLPSMDVQRRTLDGCEIAVIKVQPAAHPPVRYDGRVWVRVGPTVRQASASDGKRSSRGPDTMSKRVWMLPRRPVRQSHARDSAQGCDRLPQRTDRGGHAQPGLRPALRLGDTTGP